MFSQQTLRDTVKIFRYANPRQIAYTGTSAATLTRVDDEDGRPSKVRYASTTEQMLLAANPAYMVGATTYRITIASSAAPPLNADWWISADQGYSKAPAKFLTRNTGADGAFWVVFVQTDVDPGSALVLEGAIATATDGSYSLSASLVP